jgi:hypothetical protein
MTKRPIIALSSLQFATIKHHTETSIILPGDIKGDGNLITAVKDK